MNKVTPEIATQLKKIERELPFCLSEDTKEPINHYKALHYIYQKQGWWGEHGVLAYKEHMINQFIKAKKVEVKRELTKPKHWHWLAIMYVRQILKKLAKNKPKETKPNVVKLQENNPSNLLISIKNIITGKKWQRQK